jgi:hypothetical protein
VIGLGCILIGDLNSSAYLITNFFLFNRALINYACFSASYSKMPGWRPTFKYYHPYVSLVCAIACIGFMFAIQVYTALVTLVIGFLLYKYIEQTGSDQNWGSANQAQSYLRAADSITQLNTVKAHTKTWRPSFLVIAEQENSAFFIYKFLTQLRKSGALLFVGQVDYPATDAAHSSNALDPLADGYASSVLSMSDVDGTGSSSTENHCSDNFTEPPSTPRVPTTEPDVVELIDWEANFSSDKQKGLVERITAKNFFEGATMLVQTAGTGCLRPNVLALPFLLEPWNTDSAIIEGNFNLIRSAAQHRKAVTTLRGTIDYDSPTVSGTIDVWWLADTGGLTLLLAHVLVQHKRWKHCPIRVFVHSREDQFGAEQARILLMLKKFRIEVADVININLHKAPKTLRKQMNQSHHNLASLLKDEEEETETEVGMAAPPKKKRTSARASVMVTPQYKSKTHHYIRVGECIKQHSAKAAIIFVTMPVVRRNVEAKEYFVWLQAMCRPVFVSSLLASEYLLTDAKQDVGIRVHTSTTTTTTTTATGETKSTTTLENPPTDSSARLLNMNALFEAHPDAKEEAENPLPAMFYVRGTQENVLTSDL